MASSAIFHPPPDFSFKKIPGKEFASELTSHWFGIYRTVLEHLFLFSKREHSAPLVSKSNLKTGEIQLESMNFLKANDMAYARTEDHLAGKGVKKPVSITSSTQSVAHWLVQVHSTAEERKQRNRQAQAAFRERRTEYIKELEELVGTQKADLQRSQTAHSQATDECLMLRYKNSLLERILLEKGRWTSRGRLNCCW
jgi:hypothetical protein